MKLAFIIGYGAGSLPVLSEILSDEAKKHGFEFIAVSSDMCSEHLEFIRQADGIFIYSHQLPPDAEEAILKGKAQLVLSLSEGYAHLTKAGSEILFKARAFWIAGGKNNIQGLVCLILKELGIDIEVPKLEEIPWHGIFHPRLGLFNRVNDFLEAYDGPHKPLAGLLFYRSYMLYNQLDHVKAVINTLEKEGVGVIPVFTYGFRDALLNTATAEDSIREFFFIDGRPIIDIVIDLTSFFLLDHGVWYQDSSERARMVSGISLLKKLGVPIISSVTSFYQSISQWLEDPRGVDYLTQVYRVIMPEVDGLIEPIVVAGAKADQNGVKHYEPYEEHARYLAKRVQKWIELRHKPPSERRIAIILINPPCKNLEASVAVGFGLDVPESIAKLLHKLKEIGYRLSDDTPKDGKDLIKLILERKAISEFRWTSVEEIVKRGGAAAFVDAETYMRWFEELPISVKEKMIKDWGHPLEVLNGRASRELVGMVYHNKFVVPGLSFGNVFITVQPKFGCAGSACDGKVCRILHDPTIAPPHQWLAVYRWVSRVFKANVIIHFGTHGYLEFRPGKGVGLSPFCWPEISMDDLPHLYVYNVSNPMEGVIAKRRSYATIIDHMYPPMMMADVLEDVNSLLAQYAHAKSLGESARAQVIYDELIKKAEEANIPIKGKHPDEVLREIHRYIDRVRGTQIEEGLHIFGHPVSDPEKISEYVATVMAYDSHSSPSIRRVLAEILGLDYDLMRNHPMEVNRLGLANDETLSLLYKLSARILCRLLRAGIDSTQLDASLLLQFMESELKEMGVMKC